MSSAVRLRAPLDPVAAAHRLKAAMERRPDRSARRWVVGHGTEAEMRLRVVRRNSANSFAPMLVATMREDAGGTLIEGRIGVSRGVRLFMIAWFGFLLLFLLASLPFGAMLAVAPRAPGVLVLVPLMLSGVPLAMLGFGVLLVWLGRRLSRGDEAELLGFLSRELGAISAPAAPPRR